MLRVMIGGGVGGVVGVLLVGVLGGLEGYFHGWNSSPPTPAGLRAATLGLIFSVAYFGWLGVAVGGAIGALAGLGSAVARHFLRATDLP